MKNDREAAMTPAERTEDARTELCRAARSGTGKEWVAAIDAFAAAVASEAWAAGYQARQNDMGAADVTPNPHEKARVGTLTARKVEP